VAAAPYRAIDWKQKPAVRSLPMKEFILERLAACVNEVPGIHSTYRWQGQIEESGEELLIIKTSRKLFKTLEQRVCELHSYAVPEVIAMPIVAGSKPYLQWLDEQL
jgi:periplasmic divalent cation tolerance protein